MKFEGACKRAYGLTTHKATHKKANAETEEVVILLTTAHERREQYGMFRGGVVLSF